MRLVSGYLVMLALGVACSSNSPAADVGEGTAGEVDATSASSEGPGPSVCPSCDGVCFEGECLSAPMPIMQIDPEAEEVTRTPFGVAYLLGEGTQLYEAPLGGSAELLFTPPTDQHITAMHFDGDLIWLALRYPQALHVYDRSTQELTFLADTDELLLDILDVRQDALYAVTYEGVMRMGLDGTGQTLVTPRPDFSAVALTDDTIYVLTDTAMHVGSLMAFELDGSNPRELAAYEGFPARLRARDERVFWHVGEFLGNGEDVVRGLVDDGLSSDLPTTDLCATDLSPWALAGDSVVFGVGLSRDIFACGMDGGGPSTVWSAEGEDDVTYFVRYDSSLVGVRSADTMTLYQFPW